MLKSFFSTLFKIGIALAFLTAALSAVLFLLKNQTDYIEVYNDNVEGIPF